jgi:hypothetical protein
MPAVNLKLENKVLSTFVEILEMKIGEKMTLVLKDEEFTIMRVEK